MCGAPLPAFPPAAPHEKDIRVAHSRFPQVSIVTPTPPPFFPSPAPLGPVNGSVKKRYDDTDLILREYSENHPESARTMTAVARMNAIHGMYSKEISNSDMLFTLSLFITEPAKWIDR